MNLALFAAAFLASAVEMVEAATIVLAMGITRGWRSSLSGALTALLLLIALVAIFGPALLALPLTALRIGIGTMLLIFGLKWLRKAVLRASGRKALHDEVAIFAADVAKAESVATSTTSIDRYGFAGSFQGVFIEGVEVVFIVLTLGANNRTVLTPAAGALVALTCVTIAAVAVRKPLARVPENQMKYAVGIMATTFGTFWAGEGIGIKWPGGDFALLWLGSLYLCLSLIAVAGLRRENELQTSE